MPLTPLPADNTKRYKMVYNVASKQHSFIIRAADAVTDADAGAALTDAFAALSTLLSSATNWLRLEVALSGSNVFNNTFEFAASVGTGSGINPIDEPRAFCFAGRTSGGRKTKLFLYGITSVLVTPGSYEQQPITQANLADFHDLMQAATDLYLGIDGIKPDWYDRVTIKPNDHWVDQARA